MYCMHPIIIENLRECVLQAVLVWQCTCVLYVMDRGVSAIANLLCYRGKSNEYIYHHQQNRSSKSMLVLGGFVFHNIADNHATESWNQIL